MIKHETVLPLAAVNYLLPELTPENWLIDMTFGGGGHTRSLIEAGARVIGLDYDKEAIEAGREEFKEEIEQGRLILVEVNFDKVEAVIEKLRKEGSIAAEALIQGVLFDLGTNSEQLMSIERGLSFSGSGPLDMRLDTGLAVTARDLLMALPEKQMAEMLREMGGEEQAKGIARAIIKEREIKGSEALRTTDELVEVIMRVKGGREKGKRIHPATKVFQALRIVVNDELGNLERALPATWRVLSREGRMMTIAFHEGEDRLAKRFMREKMDLGAGELVLKQVEKPSFEEIKDNPRARSAKLRVIKKIGD